jgi:hypothetical protein
MIRLIAISEPNVHLCAVVTSGIGNGEPAMDSTPPMSVPILRWCTFSVDNGTMAHEGYVVLQLGSDVGRVEWSVDFFKIICVPCAFGRRT